MMNKILYRPEDWKKQLLTYNYWKEKDSYLQEWKNVIVRNVRKSNCNIGRAVTVYTTPTLGTLQDHNLGGRPGTI